MQRQYGKQGLVIVAVNVDEDRRLANEFLQQHPVDFKIVFDPDGALATTYKVAGMPTAIILDRDGATHTQHIGFRGKEQEKYETEYTVSDAV